MINPKLSLLTLFLICSTDEDAGLHLSGDEMLSKSKPTIFIRL